MKILTISYGDIYNVVVSEVLGTFEQAVLLALVHLGKGAYGRAILQDVQRRLQREVAAGAVYATLDRLEDKALVSSRLGSGTPVRGGRPRRYYLIESAGVHALNESKAAVENIWHGFRWPLKGRA
jgi:PadR family transcriptional regulator PadR